MAKKAKDLPKRRKGLPVEQLNTLDGVHLLPVHSTTIKGMETIRGIYKKSRKVGTLFGFSVCAEIKGVLGIPS